MNPESTSELSKSGKNSTHSQAGRKKSCWLRSRPQSSRRYSRNILILGHFERLPSGGSMHWQCRDSEQTQPHGKKLLLG